MVKNKDSTIIIALVILVVFFYLAPKLDLFSLVDESYIPISNCTDLQNIKNNLAGNYYLTKDIDCSETINWNNDQGFEPIGNETEKFLGTLLGNNKVISDLTINLPSTDYVGLFAYAENALISNVNLMNASIIGLSNTGGLVGLATGVQIIDSSVEGEINGVGSTGGLAGSIYGNSKIEKSYVKGIVLSRATSQNCPYGSQGSPISCNYLSYMGGLVGDASGGEIKNSYFEGDVTNYGRISGGLVGRNSDNLMISDSYARANIISYDSTGGLVGKNTGTSLMIEKSYSTGSVYSKYAHSNWFGYAWYAGGLVGSGTQSIDIVSSFSTSTVTGRMYVGGFVAYVPLGKKVRVTDSVFGGVVREDNSGGNHVNAFVATDRKVIVNCLDKRGDVNYFYNETNLPMSSWDFTDTWAIDSSVNNGYPTLIFNKAELEFMDCTYNYSEWSTCVNGNQTRTYIATTQNCIGDPLISQSCTSNPVGGGGGYCTPNWVPGTWSTCVSNSQTRMVTDLNNCGVLTNKPATTQICSETLETPTSYNRVWIIGILAILGIIIWRKKK